MPSTQSNNHNVTIGVTGGSGRLGEYVVNELLSNNYKVRVLDLTAPKEQTNVSYKHCDVLDLKSLKSAIEGVDGLIHLAALDFDFASSVTDEKFIEVNTLGTWNVLQTAEQVGVERVVICSSISACGLSEANPNFAPEFLPVDETHPLYPVQPYSISKLIMEEMAQSFVRRGNLAVLSLRPMMVLIPSNIEPTVERAEDLETRWLFYYISPEDCARAFRLAYEAKDVKSGEFFITATDSCRVEDTLDWYERAWGSLPKYDAEHYKNNPRASIFNGEKAKKLLGFEATSNWIEITKAHKKTAETI